MRKIRKYFEPLKMSKNLVQEFKNATAKIMSQKLDTIAYKTNDTKTSQKAILTIYLLLIAARMTLCIY